MLGKRVRLQPYSIPGIFRESSWDRLPILRCVFAHIAAKYETLDSMTPQGGEELTPDLLAAAVAASANGIVITDAAGAILWANPAFTRMTGYPLAEVKGRNPSILKSGLHDRAFYQELWSTITSGRSWHGELVNRRKDGSLYTEEMTITPVMCAEGQVANYIAIKQDVTRRRQAEEEFQKVRERLELALEAANEALWDWDVPSGRCYFSPRYYTMLGYEPGEFPAHYQSWEELLHPDDRQSAGEEVQRFLDRHEGFAIEFRLRTKTGEYRSLLCRGRVVEADETGRPVRMVGTNSDITERNKLAEQVRHAQRMEAVGVLAGGIAHDFNNLLTVINGHCSLLLESAAETSPLAAPLAEIRDAGERAAGLTRQLLAFSRRQVLRPTVVNLNSIIQRLGTMLRRMVREDIRITTTLEPALGSVLADEGQLEQVVMNLVVNSRDALPGGGEITIETGNFYADASYAQAHPDVSPGAYVMLAISDTGTGMDEETRSHLFEPFFTTKPVHKGTGLGLSTVYGIVHQSGGWIWVYSEPGKGSTFKVYLPRTEQSAEPSEQQASARQVPRAGTETVLIVEDEPALLKLAANSLKKHGYSVLTASRGPAALEIAAQHPGPIHLLLTDVIMPEMNGRELSDALTRTRPGMRVLFMSGYTDDVISTSGVLDRDVAYLQKPFSPNELARRVREVLSRKVPARVLVVDDDAAVRRFLHRALETAGYEVEEAADGRQAVDKVRGGRPSIVVLDLVMPEQEGIETIRILHEEFPELPILAISGAFGGSYLPLAKPMGAQSVMMKPIEPEALVREIRRLIMATDAHG